MSAYSTLKFTRQKAIEYLIEKINQPHMPDKQLEDMMDIILESQLYNCIITDFPDED